MLAVLKKKNKEKVGQSLIKICLKIDYAKNKKTRKNYEYEYVRRSVYVIRSIELCGRVQLHHRERISRVLD